ncbi:thioredoxin-like protein [Cladochytrium replicatum]|nr:thioredoxin-like protein [Cladochytrium replicatum]
MFFEGVSAGDTIPDLSAVDQNGNTVKLHDLVAETGIVIFFYPKAATPGCTNQACGFRDSHKTFETAGYTVYGLSADKPAKQLEWKTKNNLSYDLLSDENYEVLAALGLGEKSTKKITRSHIIVEKGGKIIEVAAPATPTNSVKRALKFIGADDTEEAEDEATTEEMSTAAAATTAAVAAPEPAKSKSPTGSAPGSPEKTATTADRPTASEKPEDAPGSPKKTSGGSAAGSAPGSPKKTGGSVPGSPKKTGGSAPGSPKKAAEAGTYGAMEVDSSGGLPKKLSTLFSEILFPMAGSAGEDPMGM